MPEKTKNKKVLLIEDEPLLVELYQEGFANEGFELLTAQDGPEGLLQAQHQPDLILLDILLPGLNGFDVLRQLKANTKTKHIPVIVLTNLGSEKADKDKQLALSLGAVDYLVKSYHTPEELALILASYLGT